MESDAGYLETLSTLIRSRPDLDKVCFKHLRACAAHFGLQIRTLNAAKLRHRLIYCHTNRMDLDTFKINEMIRSWWRLSSRPSTEDERHGFYAQRVIQEISVLPPTAEGAIYR